MFLASLTKYFDINHLFVHQCLIKTTFLVSGSTKSVRLYAIDQKSQHVLPCRICLNKIIPRNFNIFKCSFAVFATTTQIFQGMWWVIKTSIVWVTTGNGHQPTRKSLKIRILLLRIIDDHCTTKIIHGAPLDSSDSRCSLSISISDYHRIS